MRASLLRTPSTLVALLACAAPLTAQSVHTIGATGDFAFVNDAVAAAAEGDILLIEDGYENFETITIDGKSLTLAAEGSADLTSFVFTGSQPGLTIRNLAAHQRVHVRGLDLLGTHEDPVTNALLEDNAGAIVIEDCSITAAPGISMVVRDCASVVVARSTLGGFGSLFTATALRVDDSALFLHDTDVLGPDGVDGFEQFFLPDVFPEDGGDGAWIFGASTVFVSGGQILGGDGGSGGQICASGRDGGDGLRLDGTASGDPLVRTRDTVVAGGTGGLGTCGNGDGGPGTAEVISAGQHVQLAGTPRQHWMSAPTVIGDDVTLSFRGEPGDVTLLLLAPSVMHGIYFPVADLALHLSIPFADVPLGVLPASGELDLVVNVPSLPPGVDGAVLMSQALFTGTGGETVMGGPSVGVFVAP